MVTAANLAALARVAGDKFNNFKTIFIFGRVG
jgi:hypothetical protein